MLPDIQQVAESTYSIVDSGAEASNMIADGGKNTMQTTLARRRPLGIFSASSRICMLASTRRIVLARSQISFSEV
jgi:hypothetical protein